MAAWWLRTALSGPVTRRGIKYSVIVGSILVFINQGDIILLGRLSQISWIKVGLTLLVPYFVSVFSSVGALRDVRNMVGESLS